MTKRKMKTNDLVYIGLFAVLIVVCSWISIPFLVPFTLQTFAVFVTLRLLGGKRGFIAIVVYIMLGAIGLPVFSGFKGGLGALFGVTGGYIIGFLVWAAAYWLITEFFGEQLHTIIIALLVGLILCYTFGTAWFVVVYASTTGPIGFSAALGMCVVPFILPDLVKMALALLIAKRLEPYRQL